MKEELSQQVKTYADTFAEWIESTDTVGADVASLTIATAQHDAGRPTTSSPRRRVNAAAASAALTASQARTKSIIILGRAAPPC